MPKEFEKFADKNRNPLLELASERMYRFSKAGDLIARGMLTPEELSAAEAYIAKVEQGVPANVETQQTPEARPEVAGVAGSVAMNEGQTPDFLTPDEPPAAADYVDRLSADTTEPVFEEPQDWSDNNAAAA